MINWALSRALGEPCTWCGRRSKDPVWHYALEHTCDAPTCPIHDYRPRPRA